MTDLSRAWFSADRAYRYWLPRNLTTKSVGAGAAFIMLNPSLASDERSDPTVTRVIGFAKRERFRGLLVGNLFARVSPYPSDLHEEDDDPSDDEVFAWQTIVDHSVVIVAGWGAPSASWLRKKVAARVEAFLDVVAECKAWLYCLGTTKDGSPRHPLYLKSDAKLVLWQPFELVIERGEDRV